MRAVITGGAGFIGSHLYDALILQGWNLTVIDNLATGNDQVVKSTDLCHCDVRKDLTKILAGKIDVIFHLAALPRIQPSFLDPQETISVNSQGTVSVLELARDTGAKVVYAGSSSFYHDPYANPYAYSKWVGEEHCKLYNRIYGVPTAIARFFNVYGPRQVGEGAYATVLGIFQRQYLDKQPLTITGTGEQRRDFTHVHDIVQGLIAISEKSWNGEVFNLGSSRNWSINEVAKLFGRETQYIPARPGEAKDTLADISFSLANLNWEPTKSLDIYIRDWVIAQEWYPFEPILNDTGPQNHEHTEGVSGL